MDSNDLIVIEKIDSLINENDVVVDVGSNYGDYTEFFTKKLNGTGKIYSVELHPYTFSQLKNKFLNNENVKLYNNAICDRNELIDYYEGNDSCTNNIIGHDMNFKSNNLIGQIEGITLDKLLKNEDKIRLIKIDVEGSEKLVLGGMINTFSKIDYMLIECHLDKDWDEIKLILLEYFTCKNVINEEEITHNSKRQYQCLCKKK